ncbi:hypothetical protein PGQ11_013417 [Apiospora arundinis]|uniref:Uncharacterized protein n=1 Tax=Apiospora arundinis TaxID=335852 RepID=A0ABR2HP85_9PEZI
MLPLFMFTAGLSALLSGLVNAAPLSFRPFNATACMESAGLLLPRRNSTATGVTDPHPTHTINGAAGTEMTPEAIGAIVGGAFGILLLTMLLCWCGNKRRW